MKFLFQKENAVAANAKTVLIFLNMQKVQRKLKMKYYNEISRSYNELHGDEQIKKAEIIKKEILKKKSSGLLLDIGGGTGVSTEVFLDNFNCTVIDPSEKLLVQGNNNMKKIVASAEKLPFDAEKFDVIISITSLHHVEIKKALAEIKRVAKPDALVAVSFLKKSKKLEIFRKEFKKIYKKSREIEESRDIIFLSF